MARPVALTMPAVTLFSNVERRADREHPFARAQLRRIAELHDGQLLAFDLEHGDVGAPVDADDLGRIFATIGHAHRDFIRIGDDVRVGEDVAVGADDEARAFTLPRRCFEAAALGAIRHAETLEEFLERILRIVSRRLTAAAMRLLDDRHVHHRGTHLFHERREIGKHAAIQGADGLCGRGLLRGRRDRRWLRIFDIVLRLARGDGRLRRTGADREGGNGNYAEASRNE